MYLYLLRTGCPWRYLPCNFPPWQTVYYHWRQCCRTGLWTLLYRALHEADRAYQGQNLADWCKAIGDWELEVVKHAPGVPGWSQQPKRWIVERTFAWLLRSRRLLVDYERKVQTSETLIEVAMIRLLLARLGRHTL